MSDSKNRPAGAGKQDSAKPAKATKSSAASRQEKVDDARLDTVSAGLKSVAGGQLDGGQNK